MPTGCWSDIEKRLVKYWEGGKKGVARDRVDCRVKGEKVCVGVGCNG